MTDGICIPQLDSSSDNNKFHKITAKKKRTNLTKYNKKHEVQGDQRGILIICPKTRLLSWKCPVSRHGFCGQDRTFRVLVTTR